MLGDMTLWYVMNDGNQSLHNLAYHTRPLMVEVHVLAWAFSRPSQPLDKTVFVEYTIINKGTEPIEDAYVGIYADPDVGSHTDDGSACDSTMDLSYGYNRQFSDAAYGVGAPAWGVMLLQGPIVPAPGHTAYQFRRGVIQDAKNLRATANTVYYCGHHIYRQPAYSQEGALELHRQMHGRLLDSSPVVDPATGQVTTFMNAGDPIVHTGWLDELVTPPCDVYFVQGTGPFSLAPLDTQRVVYAYSVGSASTPLQSILALKSEACFARAALLSGFAVDVRDVTVRCRARYTPEVGLQVRVESRLGVCGVNADFLDCRGRLLHRLPLYDDGAHQDGAANNGVFANSWYAPPRQDALRVDLRVRDEHGGEHLFAHLLGGITLLGLDEGWKILPPRVIGDHINSDGIPNPGEVVKLQLPIVNLFGQSVRALQTALTTSESEVDFLVQGLRFEPIASGDTVGVGGEEAILLSVKPEITERKTVNWHLLLFDSDYRYLSRTFTLTIEPYSYVPSELVVYVQPLLGDAHFRIRVVDPGRLTGHA